jgi:hypothetical protein
MYGRFSNLCKFLFYEELAIHTLLDLDARNISFAFQSKKPEIVSDSFFF